MEKRSFIFESAKPWRFIVATQDRPEEFENIVVEDSKVVSAELISIIGLADYLLHTTTQKDTLIPKTLSRMVKLIQDQ